MLHICTSAEGTTPLVPQILLTRENLVVARSTIKAHVHVDVCEEIHDAIQALVIVVEGMLFVQTRRHHIDCFSQTRNHENVGDGNSWMIHIDNAAVRNAVFGDDAGLGAPATLKLALLHRHATIL